MLRLAFVTLALTLAVSAAEARDDESRMYNPTDNPTNAPTPMEFNHQEWLRRQAFGVCADLFECASGAPTGYTHLPQARTYVVEPAPPPVVYQEPYPRYRQHRAYD